MNAKQVTAMIGLTLVLMVSSAPASLTLPYEGSISEPGQAFRINNTYAGSGKSYGGYFEAAGAEGRGLYARSTNTATDLNTYGGFFYAAGPNGRGAFGQSAGSGGMGVKGWASNNGNVQNFGGHFCATGLQGIGVYGWAESIADAVNYGGYFQADGGQGVGVYAIGGPKGSAGLFEGDIKIAGWGNGIVFPDGSRQTTAAGSSATGEVTAPCGCPAPAYDSGWVDLTWTKSKALTHGLGGNLDDYVVDVQLKRNNMIGEQYITNWRVGSDFYYDRLTTNTLTVYGPDAAGADFAAWVRVRIWLCPSRPAGKGGYE